jgi:hypothetical protein
MTIEVPWHLPAGSLARLPEAEGVGQTAVIGAS